MSDTFTTLMFTTLSGLVSGGVVAFGAPWVRWEIEKARENRGKQKSLISSARTKIIGSEFSPEHFLQSDIYIRLEKNLRRETIEFLENLDELEEQMDEPNRRELVEESKKMLLKDLKDIEQRWGLLDLHENPRTSNWRRWIDAIRRR